MLEDETAERLTLPALDATLAPPLISAWIRLALSLVGSSGSPPI